MAAEEHAGVGVVQLHADAAGGVAVQYSTVQYSTVPGGVAVTRRVDQLHPRVLRDVRPPAVGVRADIAVLTEITSSYEKSCRHHSKTETVCI